jgi:hypothetical protein
MLVQQHEARKLGDWSRVNAVAAQIHAGRTHCNALSPFTENGGV